MSLISEILKYYDENEFHDWVHAETDAAVLKAQHPEFEMWTCGNRYMQLG
jgi:nitrite reductase (cytochrome c-552)